MAAICKTILVAALAASVAAHGKVTNPRALNLRDGVTDASQADVVSVSATNACGGAVRVPLAARPTPATAAVYKPGDVVAWTWYINAGDGSGPMAVTLDNTGLGTNFTTRATVTTQVPGNNGNGGGNGPKPLGFRIPENFDCGPTRVCLAQVAQERNGRVGGFGGCVAFTLNAPTPSASPSAAPRPDPAPAPAPAPAAGTAPRASPAARPGPAPAPAPAPGTVPRTTLAPTPGGNDDGGLIEEGSESEETDNADQANGINRGAVKSSAEIGFKAAGVTSSMVMALVGSVVALLF